MNIARGLNVPLYAQVDVLSMIIIACLAILFWEYRRRSGNTVQFHIKAVVGFYIAYLISDILCLLVEYRDDVPLLCKYLLNAAYFIFLACAAYFWFINVCKEIGFGNYKKGSRFWALTQLPLLAVIVLSVSAYSNQLMFKVDPVDGYSRGPWFIVFILVHYGYIVIASIVALNSYMSRKGRSKSYGTIVLVVYCVPIIVAGMLQYLFSGNYQAVGYATSLCILFAYKILHDNFVMVNILKSVTSEYSCIYLCDTTYNSITSYRVDKSFFGTGETAPAFGDSHARVHFEKFLEQFLSRYVSNMSRNELSYVMQLEGVKKRLEKDRKFSHMYISDKGHYCELQFSAMENDANSFVLAIADKDAAIKKESSMRKKIIEANRLANTDGLTGLRNTLAYTKQIEELDRRIEEGTASSFALAEFDLNYLKAVNDVAGHDVGDMYIKNSSMLLSNIFKYSPIFRTGGDEFVVIIKGQDYENRIVLMDQVRSQSTAPREALSVLGTGPTVAAGMATFRPGEDKSCKEIFKRADSDMYKFKVLMKQGQLGE